MDRSPLQRLAFLAALGAASFSLAQRPPAETEKPPTASSGGGMSVSGGVIGRIWMEERAAIQVCERVEKRDCIGNSGNFTVAPGTRIYIWSLVRSVAPNSDVRIAFRKGASDRGPIVHSQSFTIPSAPWRIYAYKTFRAGDAGGWRAEVLDPQGKPLAFTSFEVEIKK